MSDHPVLPPPPGVTPNFIDPETRAPQVRICLALSLALMWPVVAARLYSKAFMLRKFGWDDACALFAAIFLTGYIAAVFWIMRVLGPHGWNVRASDYTEQFHEVIIVVTMFLYPPISFFTKLSIFLLYLRAFGPNERFRRVIYAAIAVSLVVYSGVTVAEGVTCFRRPSETWRHSAASHCRSAVWSRSLTIGIFNISLNIFIYVLPLPIIWRLQMPIRRKIGVSCIFATGSIAIAASILGLYYRLSVTVGPDPIWNGAITYLFLVLDLGLENACASMPGMAWIFRHHKFTLPLPPCLRKVFSHYASSLPRPNSDIDAKTLQYVEAIPSENNTFVQTQALNPIQGNGAFLELKTFDNPSPKRMSTSGATMRDIPTYPNTRHEHSQDLAKVTDIAAHV